MAHLGLEVSPQQYRLLQTYHDWLRDEAIPSGGLGPGEITRLESRHIADSLLFATLMPPKPGRVLDLGTGVGLPGLPLAIVMPDTRFILIDRSRRRLDLLRRVIRILELGNCETLGVDITEVGTRADVVVARASLPPSRLAPLAKRLVELPGVIIVGGSWKERPSHLGWETIEIPGHVLDHPIWLLMMRLA